MKPRRDADCVAQTDAGHFGNCPVCGALIVMGTRSRVVGRAARIGQRCGDLQIACVQPLIKLRSARRPCGCL